MEQARVFLREDRFERPFELRDVPTAEEVDVNEQGIELVERDASLVARLERIFGGVRAEDRRAEAAEELHHREVDLPVPEVDRRIDEARRAVLVRDGVASPEIAVEERRRIIRLREHVDAREEGFEAIAHARWKQASIGRPTNERREASIAIEARPIGEGTVRLRENGDEVLLVQTERGATWVTRRTRSDSRRDMSHPANGE